MSRRLSTFNLLVPIPFLVLLFYYHHLLLPISLWQSRIAQPVVSNSTRVPSYHAIQELQLQALLQKANIGPEITYSSRILHAVRNATSRHSATYISAPLFDSTYSLLLNQSQITLPVPDQAIQVPITISPSSYDVDASPLLFGCSTTYDRFSSARGPVQEWPFWLTNRRGASNGAKVLLTLHEASSSEISSAQATLDALGIDAIVMASDAGLNMPHRYVALVSLLYRQAMEDSKRGVQRHYLALIDDDTFFPRLGTLLATLEERFDHTKEYYIGTLSDRIDWVIVHKDAFAYGGAGAFFTLPLAERISKLPCLEKKTIVTTDDSKTGPTKVDVVYKYPREHGDGCLWDCMSDNLDITLSKLNTLHQIDHVGDPSGFYESGRPVLSLHHYRSWHTFVPQLAAVVTNVIGEEGFLQRFILAAGAEAEGEGKGKWILSNGFSLAYYPGGLDFDIETIEGTIKDEKIKFAYSLGPMRKTLSRTGKKRGWDILGSWTEAWGEGGDEAVVQVYVKSRDDKRWYGPKEAMDKRDSVAVLIWVT